MRELPDQPGATEELQRRARRADSRTETYGLSVVLVAAVLILRSCGWVLGVANVRHRRLGVLAEGSPASRLRPKSSVPTRIGRNNPASLPTLVSLAAPLNSFLHGLDPRGTCPRPPSVRLL